MPRWKRRRRMRQQKKHGWSREGRPAIGGAKLASVPGNPTWSFPAADDGPRVDRSVARVIRPNGAKPA
jgi:hypothetical protein